MKYVELCEGISRCVCGQRRNKSNSHPRSTTRLAACFFPSPRSSLACSFALHRFTAQLSVGNHSTFTYTPPHTHLPGETPPQHPRAAARGRRGRPANGSAQEPEPLGAPGEEGEQVPNESAWGVGWDGRGRVLWGCWLVVIDGWMWDGRFSRGAGIRPSTR